MILDIGWSWTVFLSSFAAVLAAIFALELWRKH